MAPNLGRRPRIEIIEVSPRDGLQNEPQVLGTGAKLDLVGRVVAAGACRVEVTGFARPDLVPALADADRVAAAVSADEGVEFSALILNGRGYDRALAAGVRSVSMVVLSTDTFSRRNQRMSVVEAVEATRILRERSLGDDVKFSVTVAAAFGCPFEGDVSVTQLREVIDRIADLGPDELSLADTIGVGTPGDVVERFGAAAELAPRVPLRAHFHDTRNTGIANVVAAVGAGVSALDASLGGIGGCPFAPTATGNVATEDVVYCLERMGIDTGFDLDMLIGGSRWLTGELGRDPSSGLARAGAFPKE